MGCMQNAGCKRAGRGMHETKKKKRDRKNVKKKETLKGSETHDVI